MVTYIGNMMAENVKTNFLYSISPKRKFMLKVLAPSFAVVTLTVITAMILREAISILRDPPSEDSVDSTIMYIFAGINIVIDIICVTAFVARGREVFYENKFVPQLSLDTDVHSEGSDDFGHLDDDLEPPRPVPVASENPGSWIVQVISACICPFSAVSTYFHSQSSDEKNLNMLSAFTHLGGDTLRTISVFIAAVVSTTSGVNADLCDAWAAIVVSITIVMIMYPLLQDIVQEVSLAWRVGWDENGSSRPNFIYNALSVQSDDFDVDSMGGRISDSRQHNDNDNGAMSWSASSAGIELVDASKSYRDRDCEDNIADEKIGKLLF